MERTLVDLQIVIRSPRISSCHSSRRRGRRARSEEKKLPNRGPIRKPERRPGRSPNFPVWQPAGFCWSSYYKDDQFGGVSEPGRGRGHFGPFSGSRPEGRPGHRPEGPSSQRRDTSATTRRRDHDDDDDEEEKNSKTEDQEERTEQPRSIRHEILS